MMHNNELLVSARDAEILSVLVDERRRMDGYEARAAEALVDALEGAKTVPHEQLPEDRVALGTRVDYREEPDGARRRVTIVHPARANAALGRISVLSPVGRALLGQRHGALVTIRIPGARALVIRVTAIAKADEEVA